MNFLIVDAAMMTDRESDDAKGAVVRDCVPWPFEVAAPSLAVTGRNRRNLLYRATTYGIHPGV